MKSKVPNYTQVPNLILDNLGQFERSDVVILLTICRHTIGWHRETTTLSHSRLSELSGVSLRGVQNSLRRLEAMSLIYSERTQDGTTYKLHLENIPEEEEITPTNQDEVAMVAIEGSNDCYRGVATVATPDDPSIYTGKKGKETIKENIPSPSGDGCSSISPTTAQEQLPNPPASPKVSKKSKAANPDHTAFIAQWCEAYAEHNRKPYRFEGGKDGSAAKKLLSFGLTPEQLVAVAKEAWKVKGNWDCSQALTLAGFACRFNSIEVYLAKRGINPISEPLPTKNQEPQEASAIELQW